MFCNDRFDLVPNVCLKNQENVSFSVLGELLKFSDSAFFKKEKPRTVAGTRSDGRSVPIKI
jgi:hypothetical protein